MKHLLQLSLYQQQLLVQYLKSEHLTNQRCQRCRWCKANSQYHQSETGVNVDSGTLRPI